MLENCMTDEKLELWGEVFQQCALPSDLTFEQFIISPWEHLKRAGQEDAPSSICRGFSPLLPAQIEAKRKLESYWRSRGYEDVQPDTAKDLERIMSNNDIGMDSLCPSLN